jgi:hypothetical protein
MILMGIAIEREAHQLQIHGDSNLVVDWLTRNNESHNFLLFPVFDQLKEMERRFTDISFSHVYRELNVQARCAFQASSGAGYKGTSNHGRKSWCSSASNQQTLIWLSHSAVYVSCCGLTVVSLIFGISTHFLISRALGGQFCS